jgi:hypothetical protein
MLPERDDGLWVSEWDEVDFNWRERQWTEGPRRRVFAPTFRETTTFTGQDPELLDRKHLPKQNRIPLWRQ